MLASRRGFAIAGTTGSALAMLAACSNSHGRGDTQPSASALPSNQQEGAPYPADMGHLEQILAIGSGRFYGNRSSHTTVCHGAYHSFRRHY